MFYSACHSHASQRYNGHLQFWRSRLHFKSRSVIRGIGDCDDRSAWLGERSYTALVSTSTVLLPGKGPVPQVFVHRARCRVLVGAISPWNLEHAPRSPSTEQQPIKTNTENTLPGTIEPDSLTLELQNRGGNWNTHCLCRLWRCCCYCCCCWSPVVLELHKNPVENFTPPKKPQSLRSALTVGGGVWSAC